MFMQCAVELMEVLHTIEDGVDVSLRDDGLRHSGQRQQWLTIILEWEIPYTIIQS